MVDELFHNNGSQELPKRVSFKDSLLILHLDGSCFSRRGGRGKDGYFLGERNMEKYGDGDLGRVITRKEMTAALKGDG